MAGTGMWLGVIPPVQEPLLRGRAAPRVLPLCRLGNAAGVRDASPGTSCGLGPAARSRRWPCKQELCHVPAREAGAGGQAA